MVAHSGFLNTMQYYPTAIYYVDDRSDPTFDPIHFTEKADADRYHAFCEERAATDGMVHEFIVRQCTLFTSAENLLAAQYGDVARNVFSRLSPLEKKAIEEHLKLRR